MRADDPERQDSSPSSSAVESSRFGLSRKKLLAGGVDLPQAVGGVEGEDRDVDLRHHLAHEGRGFEVVHALPAKRLCQELSSVTTSP